MGALAEFRSFNESRPKSELTPKINEAQSHSLLKTFAKNMKSFHLALLKYQFTWLKTYM